MKLKLEITADDITHGVPRVCQQCPIARAMHRAAFNALFGTPGFNGNLGVAAKYNHLRVTAYIHDDEVDYLAQTPGECRTFMDRFDHSERCEPFIIEVEFTDPPLPTIATYEN